MWRALRYGLDGRLLDLEAPRDRGVRRSRGDRPAEGVDGRRRGVPGLQRRSAPAADDRRRRLAVRSLQGVRGRDARDVPGPGEGLIMSAPQDFSEEELAQLEAEMEQALARRHPDPGAGHADQPGRAQGGAGDAARSAGPEARPGADPAGDRRGARDRAAARGAPRRRAGRRQGRALAPADGLRAAFRRDARRRRKRPRPNPRSPERPVLPSLPGASGFLASEIPRGPARIAGERFGASRARAPLGAR